MIVVRLSGGLGNQMFQYACGRAYAERHKTQLILDLSAYEDKNHRPYELQKFNIQENTLGHKPMKYIQRESQGRNINLFKKLMCGLPLSQKFKQYKENQFYYDKKVMQLPEPLYLDGYWQSYKYFQDIESIIRQEFNLKAPLRLEVQQMQARMAEVESVSIHIRRGDYLKPPYNQYHPILIPQYYIKAGEILVNHFDNIHFFVFSDDPVWVKENFDFPYPFTLVSCQEENDPIEEFMLLQSCKHNIIANSSFSWWAAWLNTNPNKMVFASNLWFTNDPNATRDLIPEDWYLLDHDELLYLKTNDPNLSPNYSTTPLPTVDVIIPVYNGEQYIAETLQSVNAQTYPAITITVVDDSPNDLTAQVVQNFESKHPLKLIRQSKKGGLSAARNAAIQNSTSPYIAVLDADDVWLPKKLEEQMQLFLNDPAEKIGLVSCYFYEIDENGKRLHASYNGSCRNFSPDNYFDLVDSGNLVSGGSAAVIRRTCFERVGGFDESLQHCEDWDMWIRIAKQYGLKVLQYPLLNIRKHSNSMSCDNSSVIIGDITVLQKYLTDPQASEIALTGIKKRFIRLFHESYHTHAIPTWAQVKQELFEEKLCCLHQTESQPFLPLFEKEFYRWKSKFAHTPLSYEELIRKVRLKNQKDLVTR